MYANFAGRQTNVTIKIWIFFIWRGGGGGWSVHCGPRTISCYHSMFNGYSATRALDYLVHEFCHRSTLSILNMPLMSGMAF